MSDEGKADPLRKGERENLLRLRRRTANHPCFNPKLGLTKTWTTSPIAELLPFPFPEKIAVPAVGAAR